MSSQSSQNQEINEKVESQVIERNNEKKLTKKTETENTKKLEVINNPEDLKLSSDIIPTNQEVIVEDNDNKTKVIEPNETKKEEIEQINLEIKNDQDIIYITETKKTPNIEIEEKQNETINDANNNEKENILPKLHLEQSEYQEKPNQIGFENIRVLVRVRPLMKNEMSVGNSSFVDVSEINKIKLGKDNEIYRYTFDKVFGFFSSQKDIFKELKQSLEKSLLHGRNCSIISFGETGSGKTYSMFGADWTKFENLESSNKYKNDIKRTINEKRHDMFINDLVINPFSEENGIIPRALNFLFSELEIFNLNKKRYTLYCSFLQIYDEKVYDLLNEEENIQKHKSLNIKEDKVNGVFVEGISEFLVETVYESVNLLKRGERNRRRRQALNKDANNNSHTILQILVESDNLNEKGLLTRTKINFCDLSGSENIDESQKENIHLSISNLSKVINSLSNQEKGVNYKDSLLTRLLQESLGGASQTSFIVNISPNSDSIDQTIKSLDFAEKAKKVLTKIKNTQTSQEDQLLIKILKDEIHHLKDSIQIKKKRGNLNQYEEELISLKKENERLKQFVLSNTEVQKILEENQRLKNRIKKIEEEIYQNNSEEERNKILDELPIENNKELENVAFEVDLERKYILEPKRVLKDDYYKKNYSNFLPQISNQKQVNARLFTNNILPAKSQGISSRPINTDPYLHLNYNQYSSASRSIDQKYSKINPYNYQSQTKNLIRNGEIIIKREQDSFSNGKELKQFNDKLKILERLEKETGINMKKEVDRILFEKNRLKETQYNKEIENKKGLGKAENAINKLNYLYKNGAVKLKNPSNKYSKQEKGNSLNYLDNQGRNQETEKNYEIESKTYDEKKNINIQNIKKQNENAVDKTDFENSNKNNPENQDDDIVDQSNFPQNESDNLEKEKFNSEIKEGV